MTNANFPDRGAYINDISGIQSINPTWHRAVMYWAGYMRRADWALDCAVMCKDMGLDAEKYFVLEQRYIVKALEIESYLPKRELDNAAKQLPAIPRGGE